MTRVLRQFSPSKIGGALFLCFAAAQPLPSTASARASEPNRQVLPLDSGWKFTLGDTPGAETEPFNDASWRTLDVPHDWSIEGAFSETNNTGGPGGFLPAGIGWYRKHFSLPPPSGPRRVFVEFDGVMANSDVWVNGFHLGKRPYGYVSFNYELTGHLNFGLAASNILAVRVDNSVQPASRWYAGAGIYRHVRLLLTEPLHLEPWGTFVAASKVGADSAAMHVQASVGNQSDLESEAFLRLTVLSPTGQSVAQGQTKPRRIPAGALVDFAQEFSVPSPQLWEPDHPILYQLVTEVLASGVEVDETTMPFGIRDAHFEAASGFWLNGKNIKIKGVCLHHDAGALGAAVPLSVWQTRLGLLKQLGCNAIRTAHNPMAPEFLDLCDRLGFLVLDEMFDCWTVGKKGGDYHLYFKQWSKLDARDIVLRDRNHPCVMAYSVGNEIRDTPQPESAKETLAVLVAVCHTNDPTRPVTQALFRPNASHDYEDGFADLLDVIGQNYRESELLAAHAAKAGRKILGTENGHDRKVWLAARDNPAYAGQFLWTGFDYLGEARSWPMIGAGSGLFDRTGAPRPRAFVRQSWWSAQPVVYIVRRTQPASATPEDPGFEPLTREAQEFSDWTPRNRAPHDEHVEVYSNCQEVELFLNGNSLGSKTLAADASPCVWRIDFEPGTLKAVGQNAGVVAASCELRTAGKAAKLFLTSSCPRLAPDWDDVCCVRATITDIKGVPIPDASDVVTFELAGPGLIAAVDSGDNSSHEPFLARARRAYRGQCVAMIRATSPAGRLTVKASAPGLRESSLAIQATALPGRR
jgi:beta-galactosidase